MAFETFDPESFNLKLLRGYPIIPEEIVDEDEMELGNRQAVAVAEKILRRFDLTFKAPDRTGYEYASDFHRLHVGAAGRFWFTLPELVSSPALAPVVEAVAGGAQAQRTIYVKYSWRATTGELTRASPPASITVPANNLLKVTLPQYPTIITQANIYATQGAAGSEVLQSTLTDQRTWTQPDAALQTGTAAPASSNNLKEKVLCKFGQRSFRSVRGEGATYLITVQLEEVYA